MTADGHDLIAAAISDPGHWTPRGDDYEESLPSWEARAVVLALTTKLSVEQRIKVLDVKTELRRYPDRWQMVRLRRAVGGGWYVKDSIEVTDV